MLRAANVGRPRKLRAIYASEGMNFYSYLLSMLKFFLSRILPRERPIRIDLPQMQFADDAVEALGSIVRAVSEGSITPGEGADVANLVNSYARAIDMADVLKRLDALEGRINGSA